MRHYVWYRTDGELGNAETRTRGWPEGADPRDPNTKDPTAKWLRTRRPETSPDFAGFAAYDCGCDASVGSCLCVYDVLMTHYFDGGALVPQPTLLIELDGVKADLGAAENTCVPETVVSCVLKGAIPDGHRVTIRPGSSSVKLIDGPVTIAFSGGRSEPLPLTVPPQGVASTIIGKSKYVRNFSMTVRGWA